MLKRRSLLFGLVPLPFLLPSLLRQEAERTHRVIVPGVAGGQMPTRGFYEMYPTPYTLATTNTAVLVENTTTETDLFTYTVEANLLTGSHALRLTIIGDRKRNDGGGLPSDQTFRLKLGSTTLSTIAVGTLSSANRLPFKYEAHVVSMGVGSQLGYAQGTFSSEFDAATGTEDETTALTLSVTVEMAIAHADNEVQLFYATLELL